MMAGASCRNFIGQGRWSDIAIQEEHDFAHELHENEIPVVPPLRLQGAQTLHHFDEYRFAVYPCQGGRAPSLDDAQTRQWLGRFIGRIHRVGQRKTFADRLVLNTRTFGREPIAYLLTHQFLPLDLEKAFERVTEEAVDLIDAHFQAANTQASIRLHGDCHAGNVLWTDGGPHFVDFDDCMTGPAVQDIWMLLSGSRDEMQRQLHDILSGYEQFASFDVGQLALIESLRTLRMIHYAGWLARRWDDPAFPYAFPWFHTPQYWQKYLQELQEQIGLMQAQPLAL